MLCGTQFYTRLINRYELTGEGHFEEGEVKHSQMDSRITQTFVKGGGGVTVMKRKSPEENELPS